MMWPTFDSSACVSNSSMSPQTAVVPSAFMPKTEADWFALHQQQEQIASYNAMANLGFATPHCTATRTTPGPMKKKPEKVPAERKDEAYKERRMKNNDSARRSREQRRKKEEDTYQRCRILEQQNALLIQQVNYLRLQLHSLMPNSPPGPYMMHNLSAMDNALTA